MHAFAFAVIEGLKGNIMPNKSGQDPYFVEITVHKEACAGGGDPRPSISGEVSVSFRGLAKQRALDQVRQTCGVATAAKNTTSEPSKRRVCANVANGLDEAGHHAAGKLLEAECKDPDQVGSRCSRAKLAKLAIQNGKQIAGAMTFCEKMSHNKPLEALRSTFRRWHGWYCGKRDIILRQLMQHAMMMPQRMVDVQGSFI